jgi:hypothetical protein
MRNLLRLAEDRDLAAKRALGGACSPLTGTNPDGLAFPTLHSSINGREEKGGKLAFRVYGCNDTGQILEHKYLTIMKTKFSLAHLAGLFLLIVAGSLHAATTNTVTVTANPKTAGEVSGGGKYLEGSIATVTATANDCNVFADWTVGGKKFTSNPYSFTVTGNVSLTANFTQIKYVISTSSSPTNGGTTSGGGNIGCGDIVALTAKANTSGGFAFTEWTPVQGISSTSDKFNLSVTGPDSFVAHFKDIQAPKITITAPVQKATITTSAFAIQGTAKDNVGVLAVYYSLNGGAWLPAFTTNGFANWYAYVTLPPNSTNNTVSAYAVDTSQNFSATNGPVKFNCTAAGFAPLSIAEQLAKVTSGTSQDNSFQLSFDTAVFVRISDATSDGGEVGTYTYTPTGPDTAELVLQRVFPRQNSGGNADALELTFTDAYNATYTDGTNGSGTFQFNATEESAPASLDGAVLIATSTVNPSLTSTNVFNSGTFTESDSGGTSAGLYTLTQFTPVAALLVETSADATTNYFVLSFTEGATPPSGIYFSETYSSSGVVSSDVGNFSTSLSAVTTTFVGPAAVTGLQATITPTVEPAKGFFFTRTFGRGTFASMYLPPASDLSLFTNGPNDVGIVLANTRVSANTGILSVMALDPPYAVGLDDYTVDVLWKTSTSALSSNVVTDETAKLVFSSKPLAQNAAAALSGHEITVKQANPTSTGTVTFKYNNFTGSGDVAGTFGNYTYAPYTPTMALVQLNTTSAVDEGQVLYVLLNFASTSSGTCVTSRMSGGKWELKPGTFTMK